MFRLQLKGMQIAPWMGIGVNLPAAGQLNLRPHLHVGVGGGVCGLSICPFPQVLKKYPHLWCMTKPPSRRPKLYIVNLQVTQVLRAAASDLGLRTGEPAIPGTSVSHSHAPWRSG